MKTKTIYYCTNCGNETLQWMGKCPACGAWNTLTEHKEAAPNSGKRAVSESRETRRPKHLSQIVSGSEQRFFSGFGELDRVLGGGAVKGSLVLVGGAPGIGKIYMYLNQLNSFYQYNLIIHYTIYLHLLMCIPYDNQDILFCH